MKSVHALFAVAIVGIDMKLYLTISCCNFPVQFLTYSQINTTNPGLQCLFFIDIVFKVIVTNFD